ncbi:MAG: hypothetical protein PHR35_17395 [Kiritimatiellae bacterium]|nr:hypothetical protein [Kiritimatiellia bacterium]
MTNAHDPNPSLVALRGQLMQYAAKHERDVRGMFVCLDREGINVAEQFRSRIASAQEERTLPVGKWLVLSDRKTIDGQDRTVTGRILVLTTNNSRVLLVVSAEPAVFCNRLLVPLVDQCRPRLSFPNLTSKSLMKLLLDSSKHPKLANFNITEHTVRSRILGKKAGRRVRSERVWTDETVQQVLVSLQERAQWLQSATFTYQLQGDQSHAEHVGQISRRCLFKVRGEIDWFWDNVVDRMLEEATQVVKFYSGRSRSDTADHVPRPIVIEYNDAMFSDKSQNQRLKRTLQQLPRCATSVIHANPYFRASVVDFTDGSSYEVWVLSEHRIVIVPQFRASLSSAGRVCDFILARFAEGEVKDLEYAAES